MEQRCPQRQQAVRLRVSAALFIIILVFAAQLMGSNTGTTIATAPGPIALGPRPLRIPLPINIPGQPSRTLASLLSSLAPDERLYLIVRDLRADEAPGVLYYLYLDLPSGAKPAADDEHLVGSINFFGVPKTADSSGKSANSTFRSFDITELAHTLESKGRLSEGTTATILPRGTPALNAHAQIGRLELAIQ